MEYTDFIPQNVALSGSRRIGIYNKDGNRAGQIPLGPLTPPNPAKKLYSFGALSDVHVPSNTAADDFQRALLYLNDNEGVAFTCVCGDLTDEGTAEQLTQYKALVDSYSPNTPVYSIAGNHERYKDVSNGYFSECIGQPFYYSFEYGGDVFIMCGLYAIREIFSTEELQWLEETLEANRNKRCFVFEHVFPWGDSGNALESYPHGDHFAGTMGDAFQALLREYPNTVFFHGHSHFKSHLQHYDTKANYNDALGYRSVHIPSVSIPRDIVGDTVKMIYGDSEGYVVDVYADGIHLRGRDFVKGEFLPIASYWLDTTLQTVEAGTYTDSTGTIKT